MQKKQITLLFILFFCFGKMLPSIGQGFEYDWAIGIGAPSVMATRADGITVDATGNTYIIGSIYSGTVDFDPGPGTASLTSIEQAGFLAKYAEDGKYIWAKSFEGAKINSIVHDASGDVYVAGEFRGTVDFDPGMGIVNLTTSADKSIFIAKYNRDGHYVWVKMATDSGYSTCADIALDAKGYVYITGVFMDTTTFSTNSSLVSKGKEDFFIAKYDTSGNHVWAKGVGGLEMDFVYGIAADDIGNVFVTGTFRSISVDFDPGEGKAEVDLLGVVDMFVAKYSTNGDYLWAKGFASRSIFPSAIALDAAANVYVTGSFQETVDFDPGVAIANLVSKGEGDVFMAKYDSAGHYAWAKGMGGTGHDGGNSIVTEGGYVYLIGAFTMTADLDPGAGTANLVSSGGSDFFIARYDLNGHYLWATGTGSNTQYGQDAGLGIFADAANNLYYTGTFGGDVDFDPGPGIANLSVSSLIPMNAFVVKLHTDCNQFVTFTESACDSFVLNGTAYTASGTYKDTITFGSCDSIFTLNLTITGHSSVNPEVAGHYCDSVILNGISYTTSGTYVQHYTNMSGCDSALVFDITINNTPVTSISQNGAMLTAGIAESYQWLNCSTNSVITNATNQSYTATETGKYAVIVTSGICSDTSECIAVEVKDNAVQELGTGNQVQLYPNPSGNQVILRVQHAWNNATIRLLNVTGQLLAEHVNVTGKSFALNLSLYPAGVFFVEVSEGNQVRRLKIIKQ